MNRPPVIVGLGEVLRDVYPDGAQSGGAPANFVVAMNAMANAADLAQLRDVEAEPCATPWR